MSDQEIKVLKETLSKLLADAQAALVKLEALPQRGPVKRLVADCTETIRALTRQLTALEFAEVNADAEFKLALLRVQTEAIRGRK